MRRIGWDRGALPRLGVALVAALALTAAVAGPANAAPADEGSVPSVDTLTAEEQIAAEPAATTAARQPAPDCASLVITPAQTEGPYWTPDSPERRSLLEPDMAGTRIVVTGYVLTADCRPVAGALLDFWQADDAGAYDNRGYTLRGHQFTDENGRYELETVVPGLYPGRTRHIHVKVQAPGGPVLTTQLYFPDEPANARDGIFRPQTVIDIQETADGLIGTFNFVLP